jgi:hypothetical protein
VNIQQGRIVIDSVVEAPFGVDFELDLSQFTPLKEWSFDSLEVQS